MSSLLISDNNNISLTSTSLSTGGLSFSYGGAALSAHENLLEVAQDTTVTVTISDPEVNGRIWSITASHLDVSGPVPWQRDGGGPIFHAWHEPCDPVLVNIVAHDPTTQSTQTGAIYIRVRPKTLRPGDV